MIYCSGQGTQTYDRVGDKFVGNFVSGVRHGSGVYRWRDGSTLKGVSAVCLSGGDSTLYKMLDGFRLGTPEGRMGVVSCARLQD